MEEVTQPQELQWARSDVEQRLGFKGRRYTSVNALFALIIAAALTVAFYAILMALPNYHFTEVFVNRGPTQHACVLAAFWAVTILFIKWRKIAFQRKALSLNVIPREHNFILSPATAEEVIRNLYTLVDDPKHFILLNRVLRSLANLKNIGRVSDVGDVLKSQATNDENSMETSYALVRGLIWAIPVLGFIGTVLGLSQAIGGFGPVLARSEDIGQLKDSLQSVTGGLAVAFDTTLVALLAALVLQLILTVLKKREEEFLDECDDFCHLNIISKLRTLQAKIETDKEG
jgi:biopolymer transport protein ExbB/TolQ